MTLKSPPQLHRHRLWLLQRRQKNKLAGYRTRQPQKSSGCLSLVPVPVIMVSMVARIVDTVTMVPIKRRPTIVVRPVVPVVRIRVAVAVVRISVSRISDSDANRDTGIRTGGCSECESTRHERD